MRHGERPPVETAQVVSDVLALGKLVESHFAPLLERGFGRAGAFSQASGTSLRGLGPALPAAGRSARERPGANC